jgi:hypothetical protein
MEASPVQVWCDISCKRARLDKPGKRFNVQVQKTKRTEYEEIRLECCQGRVWQTPGQIVSAIGQVEI